MFTLPALRPFGKLKLTAVEGSRVRKIAMQSFGSVSDDSYSQKCVSCLTNQGDIYIITVPDLRKQVVFGPCLRREDISGISSFTFTDNGEALHQLSSSELQRISLSTKINTFTSCYVSQEQMDSESKAGQTPPKRGTTGGSGARNAIDEVTSEVADITIDSVRDHTTSNSVSVSGGHGQSS